MVSKATIPPPQKEVCGLKFVVNKALFESLTPQQLYLLGVYTLYSKKGKATITNDFAAEKAKVGMSTFKALKKQLTDLKIIESVKNKDTLSANITRIKTKQIALTFDNEAETIEGSHNSYFAKEHEREIHENILSMYNDFRVSYGLPAYQISDKKGSDNALIYNFCNAIFQHFKHDNLYRSFNLVLANIQKLCYTKAKYLRQTRIETMAKLVRGFEKDKPYYLAEIKQVRKDFDFYYLGSVRLQKYGFFKSQNFKEFNEKDYSEREITVNEEAFFSRLETISQYDLITNFSELVSIGTSLDVEIYDILREKFLGTEKEYEKLASQETYYLPKKQETKPLQTTTLQTTDLQENTVQENTVQVETPLQIALKQSMERAAKKHIYKEVDKAKENDFENDLKDTEVRKFYTPRVNGHGEILRPIEICQKYKMGLDKTFSSLINTLSSEYSKVPEIHYLGGKFLISLEKYGLESCLKNDNEKQSIALETIISDFGKYRKALNYLFLYFPYDKDFIKEIYKPSEFVEYYQLLDNKANELLSACQ